MKKTAVMAIGVLAALVSFAAYGSIVSILNQIGGPPPTNDTENMVQTNQTQGQDKTNVAIKRMVGDELTVVSRTETHNQTEVAASDQAQVNQETISQTEAAQVEQEETGEANEMQAEERTQIQERPSADNQKMDDDEQKGEKAEQKEYNFIEIIGAVDGQVVYGTPGNDRIEITAEDRDYYIEVHAGAGNDVVICKFGNCHVDGGPGNDKIFLNDGTSNASTFSDGVDGNDYLYGNDIHGLHGGEGDDTLERGDGMEGGPGADHFVCGREGGPGESGSWVIDYDPNDGDTLEGNCTNANGQPLGQHEQQLEEEADMPSNETVLELDTCELLVCGPRVIINSTG